MAGMGGKLPLALCGYSDVMSDELYTPKSDFVWLAANEEVPLAGTPEGDANLALLIRFTKDPDKSNRDWATMALGMYGPDTVQTRSALLAAADDQDCDVRGEAIEHLARRDPELALPFVRRDLSRDECGYGVFVAAGLIADRSLIELLKRFDTETDATWVNDNTLEAIRAYETGIPVGS